MPSKKKPKVDAIFQDNGGGYVIPPIQRPSREEVEKINEKTEEREKIKPKNYILVICEKPQAAMKIAYALAEDTPIKKNIGGVPYWELIRGKEKFIVVSAVGHLFGLAQKSIGTEWPVFDIEWKMMGGFARKYINVISYFAKNARDFIIACDYDVEGELIGFNVIRFLCGRTDAKRMKFSTLTKPDLLRSYEKIMKHIDFGQAYAGETRHFLDWFYGINLSRALMQALRKAGSFKILSIGRVQGPALALVVLREKEIKEFKPTPYWQVSLIIQNEHEFKVIYPKKILDETELKKFEKLKGREGEARTTKNEKEMAPRPPFDLTTLQIEAYKYFGLSPAQTMAIAQKLYLQGLISYPRTSSQKLPITIGYKRILDRLGKTYPKLMALVKRARPVEGKKTDPAHPAIFPTGEQAQLTPPEKQVYELIVKRFLACFCENAVIEEKKIEVKVSNYTFIAEGRKIIKKGWLEIYPAKIDIKEVGDISGKVKIGDVSIEKKETQPPIRYTASSLVAELEKRGLGTKGTRAIIVDTLYKRGYITGSQILATKLGISVVNALEKNCPSILDEKLTRKFEKEMEVIQKEKSKEKMIIEKEKVIKEAQEILTKVAEQFKKHEVEIGKELLSAEREIALEQKKANAIGLCPVCKKGKLIMLRSPKGKRFAGCERYPKCNATYPLPQFGMIKVSDKLCECGFPLLLLIRKGKPPWEFCFNTQCKKKEKKNKKKSKNTIK